MNVRNKLQILGDQVVEVFEVGPVQNCVAECIRHIGFQLIEQRSALGAGLVVVLSRCSNCVEQSKTRAQRVVCVLSTPPTKQRDRDSMHFGDEVHGIFRGGCAGEVKRDAKRIVRPGKQHELHRDVVFEFGGNGVVSKLGDQLFHAKRTEVVDVTQALPMRVECDALERAWSCANAKLRLCILEESACIFVRGKTRMRCRDSSMITVGDSPKQPFPLLLGQRSQIALHSLVDELDANVGLVAMPHHVVVPELVSGELRALAARDQRRAVSKLGIVAQMPTVFDLLHVVANSQAEMAEHCDNRWLVRQRHVKRRRRAGNRRIDHMKPFDDRETLLKLLDG